MRLSLLPTLAALAATVLADGAAIVSAIDAIDKSTVALGSGITSWNGKLLGALPIVGSSTKLLIDVKKGTKTAEQSEPLTNDEAFQVAFATINLAADVNVTLGAIIEAKPKFDKVLLSPVILGNLKIQQGATEEFSGAVIDKVPAELQDIAKQLVGGIADSFDQAIEAYKLF